MLYAWGAWLIFFARERILEYIEDPTLKGTAMSYKDAVFAGFVGAIFLYGLDLFTRPFRQKKINEARSALFDAFQK